MEALFQSIVDCINSTEVNLGNATYRLVVAMILGTLVGAERKRKGQIAGVRTFALISMGACLAMLLSIYVPQVYLGLKNGDPGRIAAQVITGVGFLGGGAMIHMKGSVRGLTTAAGIWMTAAIGMAVGVGMYWCSIIATLMILVTLVLFEAYDTTWDRRTAPYDYRSTASLPISHHTERYSRVTIFISRLIFCNTTIQPIQRTSISWYSHHPTGIICRCSRICEPSIRRAR